MRAITQTSRKEIIPLADETGRLLVSGATGGTSGANAGLEVPNHDRFDLTYYGTTNNVATITYRLAGVVVGTQTFTYESNTTEGSRLIRGELT